MAAAYGSLQHIFEKPVPETPTLVSSSCSWNQINSTIEPVTEIFGELHFNETSSFPPPSSSPSSFIDLIPQPRILNNSEHDSGTSHHHHANKPTSLNSLLSTPRNHHHTGGLGDSFSPRYHESLQLCTEGLGFESFDDVEELKAENWQQYDQKVSTTRHSDQSGELRRCRLRTGAAFPPPISCIGKPRICFQSYRQDGRFVLKQVSQEFLHAQREDGRLKLHFVQPSDDIAEEEEQVSEEENLIEDDEQQENGEMGDKYQQ